MITTVNQVSSAWFDNKLIRKSIHNETNVNKCELTVKRTGTSVDDLKARGKDQIRLPLPVLPLVKPVVWFTRAVVKWRSRYVAKSAYLRLSVGLQKFLGESKSEIQNTKTTETISYNRWTNWHKPWIAEANKQPTRNNSGFFSCLPR